MRELIARRALALRQPPQAHACRLPGCAAGWLHSAAGAAPDCCCCCTLSGLQLWLLPGACGAAAGDRRTYMP